MAALLQRLKRSLRAEAARQHAPCRRFRLDTRSFGETLDEIAHLLALVVGHAQIHPVQRAVMAGQNAFQPGGPQLGAGIGQWRRGFRQSVRWAHVIDGVTGVAA